ncbi:HU, DNA-binding transcriptional regulator, beta subunit (modular protein) [Candidatus Filomicrobium marinum]|uniref:HU, DNA-binding transcriptional regulator, beta subunit (Modular protein) n=2 Tax=Filomicrobium TaxID=119044 RepID=A0A0D6JIC4_9HYPH|nr:HU, DNA-binding transcriptional regulator, beta subunit (modular protein) [Candidatus Filomicrobium marinum]
MYYLLTTAYFQRFLRPLSRTDQEAPGEVIGNVLIAIRVQRESRDWKAMSKKDLIDAIAKECDLTKEKAGSAVDAMLSHIKSSMKKGEEVRIPDFGTFKVTKRAARDGRNPLTGETIKIKASKVAKFTPSKGLKDLLN